MRSGSRLLHRASLAALVLASGALLFAGCSSSNPAGSTADDWGTLAGSVTSDRGVPLPDIEIHLWAQVGGDRTIVQYEVVTGADGTYEVEEIDLSYSAGNSEDYELYVNRTKGSALPVDVNYGTYATTVTIEKGEVATANIEISEEGPGEPDSYFD
jgi:hypothetical protein